MASRFPKIRRARTNTKEERPTIDIMIQKLIKTRDYSSGPISTFHQNMELTIKKTYKRRAQAEERADDKTFKALSHISDSFSPGCDDDLLFQHSLNILATYMHYRPTTESIARGIRIEKRFSSDAWRTFVCVRPHSFPSMKSRVEIFSVLSSINDTGIVDDSRMEQRLSAYITGLIMISNCQLISRVGIFEGVMGNLKIKMLTERAAQARSHTHTDPVSVGVSTILHQNTQHLEHDVIRLVYDAVHTVISRNSRFKNENSSLRPILAAQMMFNSCKYLEIWEMMYFWTIRFWNIAHKREDDSFERHLVDKKRDEDHHFPRIDKIDKILKSHDILYADRTV